MPCSPPPSSCSFPISLLLLLPACSVLSSILHFFILSFIVEGCASFLSFRCHVTSYARSPFPFFCFYLLVRFYLRFFLSPFVVFIIDGCVFLLDTASFLSFRYHVTLVMHVPHSLLLLYLLVRILSFCFCCVRC